MDDFEDKCPEHYKLYVEHLDELRDYVESRDVIKAAVSNAYGAEADLEKMEAHYLCSALAYGLRCTRKGDIVGDLKKMVHFAEMLIESIQERAPVG